MKPPRGSSQFLGFSLVETVLAMGIISFSLTAIVALLPLGLSSARDAAASTSNALLFNKVVNQLRVAVVSATNSQIGQVGTDLYSLPQLNKAPGEKIFTVDASGQYLQDGATMGSGASKVVDVKVLDPCAEPVNGLNPTPTTLSNGGQVAFVHVNIRSAHSSTAVGASTAPASASDFWTEIDITSE